MNTRSDYDDLKDQPIYYGNTFKGEWKYQKENRYVGYQLVAFISVLIIESLIGIYISNLKLPRLYTDQAAILLFIALALDLIFLHLKFTPEDDT